MRKYLCHYTTSHGCSELFEKLQASETSSFNGEERLIKWSRWSFGSVHVVKLINKDHADENSEPTLIWLLVDLLFEIFLTNVEKSGNQKSKVIVGELRTMSNSLTPAMEWFICQNSDWSIEPLFFLVKVSIIEVYLTGSPKSVCLRWERTNFIFQN